MAQITNTRAELRRKICRALQMRFYQYFVNGYLEFENSLYPASFIHSELIQAQDYWKNGWVWMDNNTTDTQYVMRCAGFQQGSHELYFNQAMPITSYHSNPKDTFEILDTFSPMLIHDAIDDAIQYAGRYFPKLGRDHSFILGRSEAGEENQKLYDLSLLPDNIWRINSVWAVKPETAHMYSFTNRMGSFEKVFLPTTISYANDAFNGWTMVCIKTGSVFDQGGSERVIVPIIDTVAYNPAAPLSSGYVTYSSLGIQYPIVTYDFVWIFDTLDTGTFYQIRAFRTDTPEHPSQLWIDQPPSAYLDCPLIIEYEIIPIKLDGDDDTTTVPEQFILHHALSYLHEAMMNDNRSDMARHERLASYHKQKADEFELKFPQRRPIFTQQLDWKDQAANDSGDPLGWRT